MRRLLPLIILMGVSCTEPSDESTVDASIELDIAIEPDMLEPDMASALEPDAGKPDMAIQPDAASEPLPTPRFLSLPPTIAGPMWGYMVADVGDNTAYVFGGTNATAGGGELFMGPRLLDANLELPSFVPAEAPDGPSPRYCGCAAWDPVRQRAILSGGRDFTEFFSETWTFEPNTETWTKLDAEEHPNPLGCALVYAPAQDAFYSFGGAIMSGSNNQTWRLDAETLEWALLDVDGPRARYDAEFLALPDGDLLMLGGGASAAGPMYRDVWRFNPEQVRWTQVDIDGDQPAGRRIPWVVVESPTTVLYGFGNSGMSPDSYHTDLWRLDLVAGTWTDLALDGVPRRSFARWLPGGDDALGLVLGGFDGRVPLSDQWVLVPR